MLEHGSRIPGDTIISIKLKSKCNIIYGTKMLLEILKPNTYIIQGNVSQANEITELYRIYKW